MTGLFVTLEGGDGAGKTTQARLLEEWLGSRGETVRRTREPGGTEVGVQIREIVLHHRGEIDPRAEALLYAADRAQHIGTFVRPALERGEVVVQDRYIDSSVAYQGAGRVLDAAEVRSLSEWATRDLRPDLTVLLDEKSETSPAYGVGGIPHTVVVGKNGKIASVFVGSGNDDKIRAAVEKALAQ